MRKKTIQITAALFLPLFISVAPATSQWIKPLQELIARQTTQAMKKKEAEAQPAKKQRAVRFKDNGDGTLSDSKNGLVWLKNANCSVFFEGEQSGGGNSRSWQNARMAASKLADGFCGLKDGSKVGDWRLPDREELLSLANDVSNKEKWQTNEAFTGIQSSYYWSSTVGDLYPDYAFYVALAQGLDSYAFQLNSFHVLPVKGAKKTQ
jgi:hypothetical protein